MNPVSRVIGVALWPALAVLACLCASPVVAATRIDLDQGWQFRPDPDEFGDFFAWQSKLPPGTENVNVPNTWNVGRLHDYMGVGWYFRSFETPAHDAQAHVRLNFGATFYQARVWLNGVEVGNHEGGFTAYSLRHHAAPARQQLPGRAHRQSADRVDHSGLRCAWRAAGLV